MDIMQAVGSPIPVTIGGTSYQFSILTLKDYGDLHAAIVGMRIDAGAAMIAKLSKSNQEQASKESIRQAMNPEGGLAALLQEYVGTPQGMATVLWISLRRKHKEIATPAQALDLVADFPLEFVGELVGEVLGGKKKDVTTATASQPATSTAA